MTSESLQATKPARQLGELRELADGFAARIQLGPTKSDREEYKLETCGDREKARERCTALAMLAARMRKANVTRANIHRVLKRGAAVRASSWSAIVNATDALCTDGGVAPIEPATVPTFEDFAKAWTSGELHTKHPDHVRAKDATRDKEILRLYVNPHIGPTPIDAVKLAQVELVMAKLPAELAPRTRQGVAQCMRKVLSLAVYPGRYLASNPIPREWMPKVPTTARKAKAYLYPAEDSALLACAAIPVERRMAYGILIREGMRASELANLRWSDVDLEHGRVKLDANKTNDPRAWALRPDVVAALEWWKKRRGGAPGDLVLGFDLHDGARWLRGRDERDDDNGDLGRAGITRGELFERSKSRQPIRLHDLRATFVTLSLAAGKSERWVADRTGHRSSQMIALYTRQARTWAELGLGDVGAMHELIPEIASEGDATPPVPRSAPRLAPQIDDAAENTGTADAFVTRHPCSGARSCSTPRTPPSRVLHSSQAVLESFKSPSLRR